MWLGRNLTKHHITQQVAVLRTKEVLLMEVNKINHKDFQNIEGSYRSITPLLGKTVSKAALHLKEDVFTFQPNK